MFKTLLAYLLWPITIAACIGTAAVAANYTNGGNYSTGPAALVPNIGVATPSNPAGITDTTAFHFYGLAGSFTVGSSGIVIANIQGVVQNSTATNGGTLSVKYGTGTAPINGAAAAGTGTACAPNVAFTSTAANQKNSLSFNCYLNLTPGNTYWIDLIGEAITGGTVSPSALQINTITW